MRSWNFCDDIPLYHKEKQNKKEKEHKDSQTEHKEKACEIDDIRNVYFTISLCAPSAQL